MGSKSSWLGLVDLVENQLKKIVGTTKMNYEETETLKIEIDVVSESFIVGWNSTMAHKNYTCRQWWSKLSDDSWDAEAISNRFKYCSLILVEHLSTHHLMVVHESLHTLEIVFSMSLAEYWLYLSKNNFIFGKGLRDSLACFSFPLRDGELFWQIVEIPTLKSTVLAGLYTTYTILHGWSWRST